MNKFKSYNFSILKYVHDTVTGEFVNVGVVLHSSEHEYINSMFRNTYARVSSLFPDLSPQYFKGSLKAIDSRINEVKEQIHNELRFQAPKSTEELIYGILPRDHSSLQWSAIHSGIALDSLDDELKHIFERYVLKYDNRSAKERRTENEIWRDFKRTLDTFSVGEKLTSKKIYVKDDEVEFKHSWKNGKWHCIEPLSFDLSSGEYFREKAHKWLGQLSSIKDSKDEFKVYLLISPPSEENLKQDFQKAISILNKIPVEKEIVLEENAKELAENISLKIINHDAPASLN